MVLPLLQASEWRSFGDSKAEKYSSWWITSGHIHMNTAVEGGGIAFTFKPVNGDTGISATNVSKLNDNTTVLGTIK
jgi:hypothetical protein